LYCFGNTRLVVNVSVKNSEGVGALIGKATVNSQFTFQIENTGLVSASFKTGLFVGSNNATNADWVKNCVITASVTGAGAAGVEANGVYNSRFEVEAFQNNGHGFVTVANCSRLSGNLDAYNNSLATQFGLQNIYFLGLTNSVWGFIKSVDDQNPQYIDRCLRIENCTDVKIGFYYGFRATVQSPPFLTGTNVRVSFPTMNTQSTSAPTVNDDNTKGFQVGSVWINTSSQNTYIATSLGTSTATWKKFAMENSFITATTVQSPVIYADNIALGFPQTHTSKPSIEFMVSVGASAANRFSIETVSNVSGIGPMMTFNFNGTPVIAITASGTLGVTSPVGSVIYTDSTVKQTTESLSNTSWADISGYSITLTPQASTNKVMLHWYLHSMADAGGADYGLRLTRNGTPIAVPSTGFAARNPATAFSNRNDGISLAPRSGVFMDAPATLGSVTYKMQGIRFGGTGNYYINRMGTGDTNSTSACQGISTLIVQEIKG